MTYFPLMCKMYDFSLLRHIYHFFFIITFCSSSQTFLLFFLFCIPLRFAYCSHLVGGLFLGTCWKDKMKICQQNTTNKSKCLFQKAKLLVINSLLLHFPLIFELKHSITLDRQSTFSHNCWRQEKGFSKIFRSKTW